jgi:hypothetical protein
VEIDIKSNFRKKEKNSSYRVKIWHKICFIILSDIKDGGKAKVTPVHALESKQKRNCILETTTLF